MELGTRTDSTIVLAKHFAPASLAQLVEHVLRKHRVMGSSPVEGWPACLTIKFASYHVEIEHSIGRDGSESEDSEDERTKVRLEDVLRKLDKANTMSQ
eukprot:1853741-Amphidinium_carterae.1